MIRDLALAIEMWHERGRGDYLEGTVVGLMKALPKVPHEVVLREPGELARHPQYGIVLHLLGDCALALAGPRVRAAGGVPLALRRLAGAGGDIGRKDRGAATAEGDRGLERARPRRAVWRRAIPEMVGRKGRLLQSAQSELPIRVSHVGDDAGAAVLLGNSSNGRGARRQGGGGEQPAPAIDPGRHEQPTGAVVRGELV